MALKYIITSESDLPEDEKLKGLYSKEGDHWVLGVEGAVPKKQHDEFRDKNIELKRELEKFKGIDPENAKGLQQRVEELEAAADKDKDKVAELVEKRTKEMKESYEAQIDELKGTASKLGNELNEVTIDREIQAIGGEHGLKKGAGSDLIARGRQIFKRNEQGQIVALDSDGNTKYGKNGEPLTISSWVESQTREASHLFDPSQGSGSGGSGGGGGGGKFSGKNPWQGGDSFNLTEQTRIVKENPVLAKQLAAQAGKVLDLGE